MPTPEQIIERHRKELNEMEAHLRLALTSVTNMKREIEQGGVHPPATSEEEALKQAERVAKMYRRRRIPIE